MNIIVRETAGELRALGRNALGNKWKDAAIVVVIYQAITLLIPGLIASLIPALIREVELYGVTFRVSSFPDIYDFILGGVMILGINTFLLTLARTRECRREHLFSGFNHFLNAFLTHALIMVFIILWSLLFVIPGIIAAFNYSQAMYILADDPTKSPMQCIRESKEMMRGNKLSYLVMNLSFIGWAFLVGLASGVLSGIITTIAPSFMTSDAGSVLFRFVISILASGLIAYMMSTATMFYEIVSGHLVKQQPNFSRFDGYRQGYGPQGGGWNDQGPQNFGQGSQGWNVPPQQGWAPGNAQQRPVPPQQPQNWYEPPVSEPSPFEPQAPVQPAQPEPQPAAPETQPAEPAEPVRPETTSEPKGPYDL